MKLSSDSDSGVKDTSMGWVWETECLVSVLKVFSQAKLNNIFCLYILYLCKIIGHLNTQSSGRDFKFRKRWVFILHCFRQFARNSWVCPGIDFGHSSPQNWQQFPGPQRPTDTRIPVTPTFVWFVFAIPPAGSRCLFWSVPTWPNTCLTNTTPVVTSTHQIIF